jgi:hypothetical protein
MTKERSMKLALLSAVAKLLRIQFKVNGVPFGATFTNFAESHSANPRSQNCEPPTIVAA